MADPLFSLGSGVPSDFNGSMRTKRMQTQKVFMVSILVKTERLIKMIRSIHVFNYKSCQISTI